MRINRSMPAATVIPVITYPDISAATEWLEKAFGFSIRLTQSTHSPAAELRDRRVFFISTAWLPALSSVAQALEPLGNGWDLVQKTTWSRRGRSLENRKSAARDASPRAGGFIAPKSCSVLPGAECCTLKVTQVPTLVAALRFATSCQFHQEGPRDH